MSKILERMMNDRLAWWAENNNKLDKNQNGFRNGRSCIDNLVKLNTQVEIGILKGQHTLSAFLDVSSAYDNVRRCILVDNLLEEGCPTKMYIKDWMMDRRTKFIVNNEEEIYRRVNTGFPQGGVISPILYALCTKDH